MDYTENIKEIKKLILVYEQRKEQLKADYEKAVANADAEISRLKIELADLVLGGQESLTAEEENLTTLVAIRFDGRGKTYDYIWDSREPVSVGDTVQVECKWGGFRTVTVVDVRKEADVDTDREYKCAYPL